MGEQQKSGELRGTVARVVQIVRHLAEGPEDWALADLADALGLPRSTTHRLLQLLQSQGIVESDPQSHRYRPGLELYRMASLLATRMPIVQMATPLLQEIVAQCDETALLGLYLPNRRQMIFATKVDSRQPVRYVLEMNVPQSICWGATGRGILAYLPEAEIEQILSSEESSPTTGEAIDAGEMKRSLAEIRQRGYAFTHGQRIPGAVGIAVPFFGTHDQVIGDLCLTIPEFRFHADSEGELVELLSSQASRLSQTLGSSRRSNHNRYDLNAKKR